MNDEIIVKKEGTDIGYRRSYGLKGAIGALGKIEAIDLLPPLVGGTVALGTTILARKFGGAYPTLVNFAPLAGAGAGILASIPLFWWRGKKAVISGAVTSVLIGGGLFAFEKISGSSWMLSGIHYASRQQMQGYYEVDGGYGGYALPTAQVPGGVASAMDTTAFGANVT
jgi:hypothetical protein